MADIKNNAYGMVQNPKWTQKHSYAVVFTLLFIFSTYLSASVAIWDGIEGGGIIEIRGFPFVWLKIISGTYSGFEVISISGLLLNLLLYSVVSILIVYPKQLVQYLRSKK